MADEPTHPAGVPVIITLAYTGDVPDHARIGRLEYHPRSDARRMVASGEARWPNDPRNVNDRWPIRDEDDMPDDEADNGSPGATEELKPLTAMSKTELRGQIPDDKLAALGDNPTRPELLAAARNAQATTPTFDDGGVLPTGTTLVTNVDQQIQATPDMGQQ